MHRWPPVKGSKITVDVLVIDAIALTQVMAQQTVMVTHAAITLSGKSIVGCMMMKIFLQMKCAVNVKNGLIVLETMNT